MHSMIVSNNNYWDFNIIKRSDNSHYLIRMLIRTCAVYKYSLDLFLNRNRCQYNIQYVVYLQVQTFLDYLLFIKKKNYNQYLSANNQALPDFHLRDGFLNINTTNIALQQLRCLSNIYYILGLLKQVYKYVINHAEVYNKLCLLHLCRIRNDVIQLIGVYQLVSPHITVPSEKFSAQVAQVRFLTSVYPLMHREVTFLSEGPTTHLTRIRSLARMHPPMQR